MKQTKKANAFRLFCQGYLPNSPEIKGIGLYPSNRYKYFYEWQAQGKPETPIRSSGGQPSIGSSIMPSGETIGSIDETKIKPQKDQEQPSPPEEKDIEEGVEEGEEEGEGKDEAPSEKLGELPEEKPKVKEEAIGGVSEVVQSKGKDGKIEEPERKIATTIADDGIKCIVFLSLQTLALFRIAASTQGQFDEEPLLLGDFIDTCAEDFFRVRGKKLGLIKTGGK